MNKKAGERILSIYLFIIYIIVGIGIVSGVLIFKGSDLDVREIEADILSDRIIDCLVEQGRLRGDFFDADFDLTKKCGLDFKDNTEKYQGEERYGVWVGLYNFDEPFVSTIKQIESDKKGFLELCKSKGDKITVCNTEELYVLDNLGDKYLLKILSALAKAEVLN